ncbi:PepSY-associated TM region [Rhodonellum ikkaensis]|nr:PepSY-associated TM region [Rhodonellum ikkaensis]
MNFYHVFIWDTFRIENVGMNKTSKLAFKTRIYRNIHKWISIPFVIFLLVIGTTAILLAWKKQLELVPKTQGTRVEVRTHWISLDSMIIIGQEYMRDSLGKTAEIDRLDVRPGKGIAKVVFKGHFTELQIDGFTGEILSVKQRNSDLIEKIHDGSIIDFLIDPNSERAKLIYSTLTSLVLIFLCISGFYLWHNPRKIKKIKAQTTQ